MSAPTLRFSPRRVWVIARLTLTEAVRQRVFALLVALAIGLMGGSVFLREFNFGSSELKFLADFGFGAVTFFGSILAVVLSAQLFFSELESRTVLTLLARTVFRSELVVGKFLGVIAVLAAFTAMVAAVMVAVLWMREGAVLAAMGEGGAVTRLVDYTAVLTVLVLQWLKFGVIVAFTILIASYAHSNLFTVGLSFLVLAICHLQYLARDAWEHAQAPLAKIAAGAVGFLFPNFQVFNLGDRAAAGHAIEASTTLAVATYGIAYVVVLLGLAIFSFRRREI